MDMFNGSFLEFCTIQPASAAGSVDWNSDVTGDRVKLRDYEGVAIVITKPAGSATDDLTVDFQQHTAASSGSSKAVTVRGFWFNLGATAITSPAGWVYVELDTAASTVDLGSLAGTVRRSRNSNFAVGAAVTDITSDSNAAIVVFDVKSSDLDGAGGYPWFSMNSEGDAIGNALIADAKYILYGAKYGDLVPLDVTA